MNPFGHLIRGGLLFDGDTLRSGDLRLRGDRVVELGADLPAEQDQVIDAAGLLVTPGLVDLHVHVFSGMGRWAIDPADVGVATGVTTMIDAGTSGALTFPAFERFVIAPATEDVFALLNISMLGCLASEDLPPYLSDLTDERSIHAPSAVECVRAHRARIVGIKLRLSASVAANRPQIERLALRNALDAAALSGCCCMIHHADSAVPLAEVLQAMRSGDVYTHLYHPCANGPFTEGDRQPFDATRQARERGVLFDVGHGAGAFAWKVAEPACQQHGFWPDTISSDLHRFNVDGPVFDLPTTMSKLLHLGMPLAQVLRGATRAPADAAGLGDRCGRLAPGRLADVTLLRLEQGQFELTDALGEVRSARQRLRPVMTFKAGRPHPCPKGRKAGDGQRSQASSNRAFP